MVDVLEEFHPSKLSASKNLDVGGCFLHYQQPFSILKNVMAATLEFVRYKTTSIRTAQHGTLLEKLIDLPWGHSLKLHKKHTMLAVTKTMTITIASKN